MDGVSMVNAPSSSAINVLGVEWLDTDGQLLELCSEPTTHLAVASSDLHFTVAPMGRVVLRLDILSASHRVRLAAAPCTRRAEPAWNVHETVACFPGSCSPGTVAIADEPTSRPSRLPQRQRWRTPQWELDFHSDIAFGESTIPEAMSLIEKTEGDANTLTGRFPGHPSALTALRVQASPSQLLWRSWHLYPGQRPHVVTTQTTATPSNAVHAQSREECL